MDPMSEVDLNADPGRPKTPRKPWLLIALGLILLAVMAGAAYRAGWLLSRGADQPGIPLGGAISPDLVKAADLPPGDPDTVGLLLRRQDNSLFIGTGQIVFDRKSNPGEEARFEMGYDGPVQEIVVTHSTQIYYDVTLQSENREPGQPKIQQITKAGTLGELGDTAVISVWGKQQGNRMVATTLLVLPPPG